MTPPIDWWKSLPIRAVPIRSGADRIAILWFSSGATHRTVTIPDVSAFIPNYGALSD
jgi:hypothetical protein